MDIIEGSTPDDLWTPYKELVAVVESYLAHEGGGAPYAVHTFESLLRRHKQTFLSLLKNPAKNAASREEIKRGVTEGVNLPSIGRTLLSKELVDEAIIISDMFNVNEFMALELLHTAQRQTSRRPGLSRGLLAVQLYYEGRRALAQALKDLVVARDGVCWSISAREEIVAYVSRYVQQLVADGLVEGAADALRQFTAEGQLELLRAHRALPPPAARRRLLAAVGGTRKLLAGVIFAASAQRGLNRGLLRLIAEQTSAPTLGPTGALDEVSMALQMALLYALDLSVLHRREDGEELAKMLPLIEDPELIPRLLEKLSPSQPADPDPGPGYGNAGSGARALCQLALGLALAALKRGGPAMPADLLDQDEPLVDAAIDGKVFEYLDEAILSTDYVWKEEYYQRRIHYLITDFIVLMHSKFMEMRAKADEAARAVATYVSEGVAPPAAAAAGRQRLEALLRCVARLYRRDPAGLRHDYWRACRAAPAGGTPAHAPHHRAGGRAATLYKFVRLSGELVPAALLPAYLRALAALSVPRHTWALLARRDHLAAHHLLAALRRYHASLRSDAPPLLEHQRSSMGASAIITPATRPGKLLVREEEVGAMIAALKLIAAVARQDEAACASICENLQWDAVNCMFGLVCCHVPIQLKAELLKCLAALGGRAATAGRVWAALEAAQLVGVGDERRALAADLHEVECRMEEYPASRAFVSLLLALVKAGPGPRALGAGTRAPGLQPYLRHVLRRLALPAPARPHARPHRRWQMLSLCFRLFALWLDQYSPAVTDFPPAGGAPAAEPPPGLPLLLELHARSELLRLVLGALDAGTHLLQAAPPAAHRVSGQLELHARSELLRLVLGALDAGTHLLQAAPPAAHRVSGQLELHARSELLRLVLGALDAGTHLLQAAPPAAHRVSGQLELHARSELLRLVLGALDAGTHLLQAAPPAAHRVSGQLELHARSELLRLVLGALDAGTHLLQAAPPAAHRVSGQLELHARSELLRLVLGALDAGTHLLQAAPPAAHRVSGQLELHARSELLRLVLGALDAGTHLLQAAPPAAHRVSGQLELHARSELLRLVLGALDAGTHLLQAAPPAAHRVSGQLELHARSELLRLVLGALDAGTHLLQAAPPAAHRVSGQLELHARSELLRLVLGALDAGTHLLQAAPPAAHRVSGQLELLRLVLGALDAGTHLLQAAPPAAHRVSGQLELLRLVLGALDAGTHLLQAAPPAAHRVSGQLELHARSELLRLVLGALDAGTHLLQAAPPAAHRTYVEQTVVCALRILDRALALERPLLAAAAAAPRAPALVPLSKLLLASEVESEGWGEAGAVFAWGGAMGGAGGAGGAGGGAGADHVLAACRAVQLGGAAALRAARLLARVLQAPPASRHLMAALAHHHHLAAGIRHGFVECLEAEEWATDDEMLGDLPPEELAEVLGEEAAGAEEEQAEEAEGGLTPAGVWRRAKRGVLALLLQALPAAPPNLAHFLLGYQLQEDLSRSSLHEAGGTRSCFHAILDILDQHIANHSPDQQASELVESCYRVVYWVVARPATSGPALRYLRARDYFLARHAGAAVSLQKANAVTLSARSWVLRACACEAGAAAAGRQHAALAALLAAHQEWQWCLIGRNLEGLPVTVPVAAEPCWELFHAHQLRKALAACDIPTGVGGKRISVSRVHALLSRELASLHASAPQRNLVAMEIQKVLDYVTEVNKQRNLAATITHYYDSWRQLTEILFCVAPPDMLPLESKKNLLLQILQDLLNKIPPAEVLPQLGNLASGTVLLLLVNLRHCYLMQKRETSLIGSACGLEFYDPWDQIMQTKSLTLKFILNKILSWILVSGVSQKMRVNLYGALLNFLNIVNMKAGSDDQEEQEVNNTYVSLLDSSIVKPSKERSALKSMVVDVISGFGEQLCTVVCGDCVGGGQEVCRMVALSCLEALVDMDPRSPWLPALTTHGYLRSLIDSLLQDDAGLMEALEPNPSSLRVLYLYESKMALLIKVAGSRGGAETVLAQGALHSLASLRALDRHPDVHTAKDARGSDFLPPVTARFRQILVPALALCDALLNALSSDNHSCVLHVSHFLLSHADCADLVLRALHPDSPSDLVIEAEALTSVIARTATPAALEALEAVQGGAALQRLHALALALLARLHQPPAGDLALHYKILCNLLTLARNLEEQHGPLAPALRGPKAGGGPGQLSGPDPGSGWPAPLLQALLQSARDAAKLRASAAQRLAAAAAAPLDDLKKVVANESWCANASPAEIRSAAVSVLKTRVREREREGARSRLALHAALYVARARLRRATPVPSAGGEWRSGSDDLVELRKSLIALLNDRFTDELLDTAKNQPPPQRAYLELVLKDIKSMIQFSPL